MNTDMITIGLVSVSDRASQGIYPDLGIPALKDWLQSAIKSAFRLETRLIPDDRDTIEKTLRALVDEKKCSLILTTGGTGPARRDQTPDATLAVGTREIPGIAERMRQISLHFVPTAVLSRQAAVICDREDHSALILNLPGRPAAIRQILEGYRDSSMNLIDPGIFTAIPYCIELLGGPSIETNEAVCKAWRPPKEKA